MGDRLSFRRFTGLSLEDKVPDYSTISRFRTLVTERGLAEPLFAEVTAQIEAKGLVIRTGTLIDATAIVRREVDDAIFVQIAACLESGVGELVAGDDLQCRVGGAQ